MPIKGSRKQFCPKNHDIFICGRRKSGRCNQCANGDYKPHPRKKTQFCPKGHERDIVGKTSGGACAECQRLFHQTEDYKEYKKEYYIINRERIRLKDKLAYLANPEKYRKRLATLKVRFSNLKSKAKRKKIEFTLSFEEYEILLSRPCFYCEGPLTTFGGGLDRYDNTQGYTNENSVPCCRTCNVLKMDLPIEVFFSHIKKIYKRFKKGLLHRSKIR